jgi:outer membrane immunogenic protein
MRKLVAVCAALCALAFPAVAADLDVSPLGTYPLARPIFTWTGCRIGVNIGGGSARTSWVDTTGAVAENEAGAYLGDHTASGVIGGGQLGCDYQVGRFVFGIQGRYDLTGMKASNIEPLPAIFQENFLTIPGLFGTVVRGVDTPVSLLNETFIQSSANVTARIGFAVVPNVLLYATAGLARNHNLYNIFTPGLVSSLTVNPVTNQPVRTAPPNFIVALGSNSPSGPLVGLGFEWAVFGTDISLFLEYDYVHLGTKQVTFLAVVTEALPSVQTFPIDVSQNVNMVLFGINYRFVGGSSF